MESSNSELNAVKEMDDSGCVQDEPMLECYRGQAELMDLSDDVLLCILRLCTPRDLKALGYSCPRLGTLICDHTLWNRVDARDHNTGKERMRWYLDHCLSAFTQEIKVKGYVNKEARCLGVQDLSFGGTAPGCSLMGGMDDRGLLGMWYPHLPRYAMAPRWPDKSEAAGKCYYKDFMKKSKSKFQSQIASNTVAGARSGPSANSSTASNSSNSVSESPSSNNTSDLSNIASTSSGYASDLYTNIRDAATSPMTDESYSSDEDSDSKDATSTSSKAASNSSNAASNSNNAASNSNNSASNSGSAASNSGSAASNLRRNVARSRNTRRNYETYKATFLLDHPTSRWTISPVSDDSSDAEEPVTDCLGPQFTFDEVILRRLRRKCCNLTSLALEYCNLDYRNTTLSSLPRELKKLSLKGTRCYNLPLNASFLGKIQESLPALEYLDISECEWFEPASLMSLSKLKALEALYMKECRRLTECVAYASLATRYGFQKLKILDVRGSMVADSEVSAFGWLPLLEELYVSPPDVIKTVAEHAHKWEDVLAPSSELEQWEIDEPDYYTCKTPEELMKEEEEQKEVISEDRLSDVMLGNYLTCASLESRIIVVHPSRNQNPQNDVVNPEPPRPFAAELERNKPQQVQPEPQAGPSHQPHAESQGSPSGPSKRSSLEDIHNFIKRPRVDGDEPGDPQRRKKSMRAFSEDNSNPERDTSSQNKTSENGLNLVKRPRSDKETSTTQDKQQELARVTAFRKSLFGPQNQNAYLRIRNGLPILVHPGPDEEQDSSRTRAHRKRRRGAEQANPIAVPIPPNSDIQLEQADLTSRPQDTRLQENPDPNAEQLNPEPNNSQDSVPKEGGSIEGQSNNVRPNEGQQNDAQPNEGQQNDARSNEGQQNNARPNEGQQCDARPNESQQNGARPNEGQQNDARRIGKKSSGVRRRRLPSYLRNESRPIVQINIDVQRENISQTFPLFGYHLVTDSAVLRFGRADNESINYVHIGHVQPNERGVRPDRSNLRVLSITGFRSITNRSLEHLATAAPHLRLIDFSHTGVTARGVEIFKAIRPDCEVIFSEFVQEMLPE